MDNITLKDLLLATEGRLIFYKDINQQISNVSVDTRTLKEGDLFFALKGNNFDGHNFISDAIKKKCSGIVVSKLSSSILSEFYSDLPAVIFTFDTLEALGKLAQYYIEKLSPTVIGITGSNGKTTTKEIIYSIFSSVYPALANPGNYNNLIGIPLSIFNLKAEHKFCILELGISFKKEMDKLIKITNPSVGIITNIGKTHLEFLLTEENVFEEKKKLIDHAQVGIINIDNKYLNRLNYNNKTIITFSTENKYADIFADNIQISEELLEFELISLKYNIKTKIKSFISGKYNIYNILAAIAVSLYFKIDIEIIKQTLLNFKLPKMRMERIVLPTGTTIFNDSYNANPDSMITAIGDFMKLNNQKRKILVLGDMCELGDSSKVQHIELGKFINNFLITKVYLFGENIKYTMETLKNAKYFNNIDELVDDLKNELKPDTEILFKASRKICLERIIQKLCYITSSIH